MSYTLINPDFVGNDKKLHYLNTLFKLNVFSGVLSLVTAIIIFVVTDKDGVVPIYTNYPLINNSNSLEYDPSPHRIGKAVVGHYSGAFLLVVCIHHLLVASVWRQDYND